MGICAFSDRKSFDRYVSNLAVLLHVAHGSEFDSTKSNENLAARIPHSWNGELNNGHRHTRLIVNLAAAIGRFPRVTD
jgi:hypothetical protein